MNIHETKLDLIQKIISIQNEALVNEIYTKVKQILKDEYQINEENDVLNESTMTYTTKEDEKIVGSTVDGKPLTQADLIARSLLSKKQYLEGNYITLEDLEKESENW